MSLFAEQSVAKQRTVCSPRGLRVVYQGNSGVGGGGGGGGERRNKRVVNYYMTEWSMNECIHCQRVVSPDLSIAVFVCGGFMLCN